MRLRRLSRRALQDQAVHLSQVGRVVAYVQHVVVVPPDHPGRVALRFFQDRYTFVVYQLTGFHIEHLGQLVYRHLLRFPGAFLQPDYRAAWYTARSSPRCVLRGLDMR
jgi:hypothetical protein